MISSRSRLGAELARGSARDSGEVASEVEEHVASALTSHACSTPKSTSSSVALLTALDSGRCSAEKNRTATWEVLRWGRWGRARAGSGTAPDGDARGHFFSRVSRGGFVRPVVAVAALLVLAVSVSVAGAARSATFATSSRASKYAGGSRSVGRSATGRSILPT